MFQFMNVVDPDSLLQYDAAGWPNSCHWSCRICRRSV